MSRFFRGRDDSSSESSSDEEDLYSEEEELEQQDAEEESEEESSEEEEEEEDEEDSSDESDDGAKKGASRFLKGDDSDSDESDEEVRGKVLSAKDKRYEELESIIKLIENAKKIDDWGSIATGKKDAQPNADSGPFPATPANVHRLILRVRQTQPTGC